MRRFYGIQNIYEVNPDEIRKNTFVRNSMFYGTCHYTNNYLVSIQIRIGKHIFETLLLSFSAINMNYINYILKYNIFFLWNLPFVNRVLSGRVWSVVFYQDAVLFVITLYRFCLELLSYNNRLQVEVKKSFHNDFLILLDIDVE